MLGTPVWRSGLLTDDPLALTGHGFAVVAVYVAMRFGAGRGQPKTVSFRAVSTY
ncbi:hypothetical protein MKSMC1_41470 [Mycobacterium kansasii]|nr:hypothetical protein MKSMC1_41470 [Mycobacterium kansasii]